MITARRLESGYWLIRGDGPCEWSQPPNWPCTEEELRAHAFAQASEWFIREAMDQAARTVQRPAGAEERDAVLQEKQPEEPQR